MVDRTPFTWDPFVRTWKYDPGSVIVIVGAFPLWGVPGGSFITVTPDEDRWKKIKGCDGEYARVRNKGTGGQISFNLFAQSPANALLAGLDLFDEASHNGVIPIFIKDMTGLDLVVASHTWIKSIPDYEKAEEATTVKWTFDASNLTVFHGGSVPITRENVGFR